MSAPDGVGTVRVGEPRPPAWPEPAYRCSVTSTALGEDQSGTASTVRSWLLVEVPGAWPETALDSRALPPPLAGALSRAVNRHGVRLVLLRRPGRSPSLPGGRSTCFVAHTAREDPWLARFEVGDLADLLDLDLATLATGHVPPPAERIAGPLFGVCTHGRHDPCCAERGRPVAAALAVAFPERTWEVSHIGGDRFAANVVCFPAGIYLGRVPAESAAAVGRAYVAGHLPVEHLRGRMSDPAVVQAADAYLRRSLGVTGIDAVRPVARQADGPVHTVRFRVDGPGPVVVRVRAVAPGPSRALTCRATGEVAPPAYELVDIRPA